MYLVSEQSRPVESFQDLVGYFQDGAKTASDWRVGTEYEMFGVVAHGASAGRALSYSGSQGIGMILEHLAGLGWEPVREADNIIALTRDGSQVSIEPGGQLEHAPQPYRSASEFEGSMRGFLSAIEAPSQEAGIAWLPVAFRPWGTLEDVPWMPKQRYVIMREYMPTRGGLAHEMMKRTTTVQVNLDYSDEVDALEKMRACMAVTSILTAIYANSPIVDGKPSAFQSYRSHVWTDTDPDRCGLLPLVFDDGDFFSRYADWALDVPMFFVHRGTYLRAQGMTFRQFMVEGFQGHRATMDDWGLHLSTLFPEARIKRFIEVRGCDAGSIDMNVALGAFVSGYLYDRDSCAAATKLTEGLDMGERRSFGAEVSRKGLSARLPGGSATARELAQELLEISKEGLLRRAPEELAALAPIEKIVATGRTQATELLDRWKSCAGEPTRLVEELKYRP